jgi:hypothetical protein
VPVFLPAGQPHPSLALYSKRVNLSSGRVLDLLKRRQVAMPRYNGKERQGGEKVVWDSHAAFPAFSLGGACVESQATLGILLSNVKSVLESLETGPRSQDTAFAHGPLEIWEKALPSR